jgi:hypothetical protein
MNTIINNVHIQKKNVRSKKKTNNEVLKQLKLKRELFNTIRQGQIRFFGHIKRHSILKKKIFKLKNVR